MLGKIKKALGIEGVKVKLQTESKQSKEDGSIEGALVFSTQSDSKIRSFSIVLTERYSRGRGKDKLTDEYTLGNYNYDSSFSILKEEVVEIPFSLKYDWLHSEMDKLQEGNFITAGIIGLAKRIKGVKSSFTLRVDADVVGTKLDPYDTVEIKFK